ncbi:MAG: 2-dehydropantoate 2-reductase [Candidatus Omnitrophica bacterium]|nr:2-dehydropantoate 2-reductase [Candidatus Omnitrophota bacterium]MDD5575063.1 2-dehydropantoate 2-reductase [Candidatus Omnitrophota bacterium]
MKVAVIGLGAIGGLVACYLKSKGIPVIVVGRPEQKEAVEREGFVIDGVRGRCVVYVDVKMRLEERVDLAIVTVKTQDIRDAIDKSRPCLAGTDILSTQNGVRADKLLGLMLGEERIISSIVMFGSTYVPYNKVVHNFEGNWLIGRPYGANDDKVKEIIAFLSPAFPAVEVENIQGMKWTKIFLNSGNSLPALLGKSVQETYGNMEMCKVALRLQKEGFDLLDKLGITPASMPEFDVEKLRGLAQMPLDQAAPIFSQIMVNLSKAPLYGSILQSIQRGRASEIDYINGEFANQAKLHDSEAILNSRIVELVHQVERTKKFMTEDQVLEALQVS